MRLLPWINMILSGESWGGKCGNKINDFLGIIVLHLKDGF